jgi:hypothetical protein
MYFPYLFGRRFELLALRGASDEFPLARTVVPVIEPVKHDPGDLRRCLHTLGSAGVRVVVISNPHQGDFRDSNPARFRASLAQGFAQHGSLLPGLLCDQRIRMADVNGFLESHPNRDVALLYCGPQLATSELRDATAEPRVRFHIGLRDQMAANLRALLPRGKAIDIRDRFNALARNADYAGSEYFSDSHQNFHEHSIGYGDYSVIGSVYHEGGGPAHAVAIHAIFKQIGTEQVWVEHFVSDDVDPDVGSVDEKFHQAAAKLMRAASRRRAEFGQDSALAAYASNVHANHYPGLGENKRREIHHHIAINHSIIEAAQ